MGIVCLLGGASNRNSRPQANSEVGPGIGILKSGKEAISSSWQFMGSAFRPEKEGLGAGKGQSFPASLWLGVTLPLRREAGEEQGKDPLVSVAFFLPQVDIRLVCLWRHC